MRTLFHVSTFPCSLHYTYLDTLILSIYVNNYLCSATVLQFSLLIFPKKKNNVTSHHVPNRLFACDYPKVLLLLLLLLFRFFLGHFLFANHMKTVLRRITVIYFSNMRTQQCSTFHSDHHSFENRSRYFYRFLLVN